MKNLGLVGALLSLTLVIASVYGWVANVLSIFGLFNSAIGAELVVRLIGVFVFPLGAIAGYF